MKFYIASTTDRFKGGIYLADLDMSSGELSLLKNVDNKEYISFITTDSKDEYLYAVSTSNNKIYSYFINQDDKSISLVDSKPLNGLIPCYISITTNNNLLFVANYNSSNCLVIQIKDGIMNIADSFVYEGSSQNKVRQESSHPHSIVPDKYSKFVYVADLGTDKIMIYSINSDEKSISPASPYYKKLKPGSGPRHLIFYNKYYAYVINELNSTISSLSVDNRSGNITENQIISTVPSNYSGTNWAADIHTKGQFIYASNRGHNSIAVFRIHEENGKLIYIENTDVHGEIPRSFAIDPTGKYILIAKELSNNITCFIRDYTTGKLIYTGFNLSVPVPQHIKFI